jgi:hypothetical protein
MARTSLPFAWKSLGPNLRKKQYDEIVRQLLSAERVELWDACERDSWRPHRAYAADWKLAEASLRAELGKLVLNRRMLPQQTFFSATCSLRRKNAMIRRMVPRSTQLSSKAGE